ncbi:MAG: DMT family transporter, partial [Vicinamibacteria bacterium]
MIAATQIIPFMDGFAKYLSPRYSPWQLVWARFLVHIMVLLPILLLRFDRAELWPRRPLLQIARGGFLTLATALFFAALARIPLADGLALLFCYPFVVSMLSPWLLGERPDPRLWFAVAIGLLGVLVVLRPGFVAFDPGSLLALAAGVSYSLYFIATRQVSGTSHPLVTLAYTGVFGAVVLSAAAPAFWVTPRSEDLPFMAGIGLTAALGHYLLILAFE